MEAAEAASKFYYQTAFERYSRTLAMELAPSGIRVTSCRPALSRRRVQPSLPRRRRIFF